MPPWKSAFILRLGGTKAAQNEEGFGVWLLYPPFPGMRLQAWWSASPPRACAWVGVPRSGNAASDNEPAMAGLRIEGRQRQRLAQPAGLLVAAQLEAGAVDSGDPFW